MLTVNSCYCKMVEKDSVKDGSSGSYVGKRFVRCEIVREPVVN